MRDSPESLGSRCAPLLEIPEPAPISRFPPDNYNSNILLRI